MELPCTLSEEELSSRSSMLAETVTAKDDTNLARTSSMKGFKDRLTWLDERQRELATMLRSGIERRMVGCIVEFHAPVEASKRIIRVDTGEFVREEPMSAVECQAHLFAPPAEYTAFPEAQDPELPLGEPLPPYDDAALPE
jgi:hypothetical protein